MPLTNELIRHKLFGYKINYTTDKTKMSISFSLADRAMAVQDAAITAQLDDRDEMVVDKFMELINQNIALAPMFSFT